MRLKDFSEKVQGSILGDPDAEITGVAGIQDAGEGDITFLASRQFNKYLTGSRAACVIVREPVEGLSIPQLLVANPYYAFAIALEHFYPKAAKQPGISTLASLAGSVKLGKDVTVMPFACISDKVSIGDNTVVHPGVFVGDNTRLGADCVIHANVVIRENVQVGDRVVIHAGTVVGSDGFGYVFEKGRHYKIPQVGGVIIGDDVEIGSNVSIDRANLGNTIIGKGTKIDNLVQIAHNVTIGDNSLIIAQVGIGGSTEIGSFVTLAGQVGVADHTTIESGTMAGAQSGLMGHVKKGTYSGTFALPHRDWLRSQSVFAQLPALQKKIKELEDRIQNLEKGE